VRDPLPQKQLARESLLVCPIRWAQQFTEKRRLEPSSWDWQPTSSLGLGDVGGGPGSCKHSARPLLDCKKGAGGGGFHFLVSPRGSFP